jgi:hypothetical protein
MKPFFLLPLICIGAAIAPASAQDFKDGRLTIPAYVRRDLASWTKRGTPVLFTSCLETSHEADQDKETVYFNHLIFFPPGAAKGKYVDFRWMKGQRPSDAGVFLAGTMSIEQKRPHVVVDLPDQGGPWEVGFAQMNGEYLLRRPMTLVEPKDFLSVISKPSQTPCPDWDATAADPQVIFRFYRKMGWDKPLPLPSASAR